MRELTIAVGAFIMLAGLSACGSDGSRGPGGAGGASGTGGSAGAGGIAGAAGRGGAGGSGATGGVTGNATVDETVLRETATVAFSAAELTIGGDGEGGAVELVDVGTSAIDIVIPPESRESATVLPKAGTGCECTENSCAFDGCDHGSGLLLSGSISWTESTLDCDYMVAGNQGGAVYSFTVFCDLDYTQTSLDGQLNTSGSVELPGATSSWHSQITFNNVTYVNGHPTGGSIDVSASATAAGETHTANATVSF